MKSQIIPASYNNEAKRIQIPDLPPEMIPASPEDLKIPVPPSGMVSPMTGLGTPQDGRSTPLNGVRTPAEGDAVESPTEMNHTDGTRQF